MCFASAPMMAVLPVCLDTALVVDCGFTETTVLGIAHGVPLLKSVSIFPAAGKAVHEYARRHDTLPFCLRLVDI